MFLLLIMVITPFALASCSEDQIDINSASVSDLDKLYGIGAVKAQSIIESRHFQGIDDLKKVKGIGEITLQKIKEQGLACVKSEEDSSEENFEEKTESDNKEFVLVENSYSDSSPELITLSVPEKENSKDIKTKLNRESLGKSDYAKYGFVLFCVLIGFLFIIKNRKNKGLV